MTKRTPKLCIDCRHHRPIPGILSIKCVHPLVLMSDPRYFGMNPEGDFGVYASVERDQRFFAACGARGKLWEPIEDKK